jgi:hypothetical protein
VRKLRFPPDCGGFIGNWSGGGVRDAAGSIPRKKCACAAPAGPDVPIFMPPTEEIEEKEEFIRQLICKNLRKLNRNTCKLLKTIDASLALHVHHLLYHTTAKRAISASREWTRWLDLHRQAASVFV